MSHANSCGTLTVLCNSKTDPARWKALRPSGFGASDIGKLCGLVPYGDPAKLRAKTILLKAFPELDSFKGSAATWAGNTLATPVAELWHSRAKYYARIDEWEDMLQLSGLPWLYVTPDYRGHVAGSNQPYPIEIKCVDPKVHKDYWSDGPPKHVKAQAMLQAWFVGAEAASVVQWHWGAYPKDYTVPVDEHAIEWTLERVGRAWASVLALRANRDAAIAEAVAAGLDASKATVVIDRAIGAPEAEPLSSVDPEPSDAYPDAHVPA